jgi:hypothetical protein
MTDLKEKTKKCLEILEGLPENDKMLICLDLAEWDDNALSSMANAISRYILEKKKLNKGKR